MLVMNKSFVSVKSCSIGYGSVMIPTRSLVLGRRTSVRTLFAMGCLLAGPLLLLSMSTAAAQQAGVGLGTAGSFAVLGGSTVTNTGPTVVNGDLGVSPGNAVTGFPPGQVNGTIHAGNATAAQAQSDLTTAYNDAAGRACDVNLTGQDLGGNTLTAGAHCFSTSAQLTGTVTLNAQGNAGAVFIFKIGSTLTTASASSVNLINGAQACNVFWQVGSSATLGTNTAFKGNILAAQSITLNTNATIVQGRALARAGAVTMDNNTITRATCAATTSPSPSPTATASPSPSPTASATTSPTPTPTPTASITPTPTTGPTATVSPGTTPVPTSSPGTTPVPTSLPDTTPVPGDPDRIGDAAGSGGPVGGGPAGGAGGFPSGGVATGGGSTASAQNAGLFAVGTALLAATVAAGAVAGGIVLVRRGTGRKLRRG